MIEQPGEEVLTDFGKRIQRCYGCFVAYYLKDMYLGEDATFFAITAKTKRCSTLTIFRS